MRQIDSIIIHCSATEAGHDFTAADIDRWHRERGFEMIGYHYVIRLDGRIERGRPVERPGAHCTGHNARSIGICYIGGLLDKRPRDTRTKTQIAAMRQLVNDLQRQYPSASVHGHNEFARKDCPCFCVATDL